MEVTLSSDKDATLERTGCHLSSLHTTVIQPPPSKFNSPSFSVSNELLRHLKLWSCLWEWPRQEPDELWRAAAWPACRRRRWRLRGGRDYYLGEEGTGVCHQRPQFISPYPEVELGLCYHYVPVLSANHQDRSHLKEWAKFNLNLIYYGCNHDKSWRLLPQLFFMLPVLTQ